MTRWIGWGAAGMATIVAAPMLLLNVLMPSPRPPSIDLASSETPVCTVASVQKPPGALLDAKDVAAIAHRAGWRGDDITIAVAVARAESGWNPKAVNNKNANGSVDYGLFQINTVHEAILASGNWADPEDNAKMAFQVWTDAGRKWGPWVTYWSGSYKKYLEEVEVKTSCAVPQVAVKGTCGPIRKDFPNGRIPRSALCSLWANRNHYLRADAAAKFDALSKAFTAQFGVKPCMTDSYRSLEAQISVARRKPGLAAVPGTSNHGWGMALDLCEPGTQHAPRPWPGSEKYHTWMRANSEKYGWIHPLWARENGSRPEKWHFECNSCGAK